MIFNALDRTPSRVGSIESKNFSGLPARARGHISNLALFRAAALLFLLPNAVFALGLNPIGALTLLAGCLAAGAVLLKPAQTPGPILAAQVDFRTLALCVALSSLLLLLSGELHLTFAASDWLTRDTILGDLAKRAFPVVYSDQGETYFLRAPLGAYLTPSLAGRAFGLMAAHYAFFAQNVLLLSTILYFFCQFSPRRRAVFAALFLCFAGVDVIPALIQAAQGFPTGKISDLNLMLWSRGHGVPNFTFWGHVPQLFWAPNHVLPGWWFAALVLLHAGREVDLAVVAASFVTLLFWSPLAMMGALPFLALCALDLRAAELFSRRLVAAFVAGLGFLAMLAYLRLDAESVPHKWLAGEAGFWSDYVLLVVVGMPQAIVVALAWKTIEPRWRRAVLAAIVALLLIPLFSLGKYNDFVVRVPLTPLAILAAAFCRIALAPPGRLVERLAWAIIVFSAPTAILEGMRGVIYPAFSISDCNLLTVTANQIDSERPAHYLARASAAPAWLLSADGAPLTRESRICWPDHPGRPENMPDDASAPAGAAPK